MHDEPLRGSRPETAKERRAAERMARKCASRGGTGGVEGGAVHLGALRRAATRRGAGAPARGVAAGPNPARGVVVLRDRLEARDAGGGAPTTGGGAMST